MNQLPLSLRSLPLLALLLALVLPVAAGAQSRAQEKLLDPGLRSDRTGTVLITGANRGIGLELARNYAERGWRVIATARAPESATELQALAAEHAQVSVEKLDVTSPAEIAALAASYRDQPIDVLLNNAAILGEPAAQKFGSYDFALLHRVLDTNVAGPLRLAEAFIEQVAASEQKKIVALTSVQGSITMMRSDSIQFYNASKTALNMSMRALAAAVRDRGVTVALISPGAVDTDMMAQALAGSNFRMRLLTPAESAEAVVNVIDQTGPALSGTFLSHEGMQLPW